MKAIKKVCYIDYLDSRNNYIKSRKSFESYQDAFDWMVRTFDTIDKDFIYYY
ncbi:MAG: hypothetical protein HRT66_04660 [Flavobacteriaceae bacterium]|nr:hypothetical protein [Flavobacteriaceae bacterium]